MTDTFTPSPELAEKAAAMAQRIYEDGFKQRTRLEKAQAELAEAEAAGAAALVEYQWVLTHPALPAGWEPKPVDEKAEAEKPKRTRRTKEQIAADKAAEEAAKAAPAANESDDAAQAVEGAGVAAPRQHVVTTTDEGATVAKFPEPVAEEPVAAPVAPPAPPAPSAAASTDLFDPFGQGA